jgi:hypothetical protein
MSDFFLLINIELENKKKQKENRVDELYAQDDRINAANIRLASSKVHLDSAVTSIGSFNHVWSAVSADIARIIGAYENAIETGNIIGLEKFHSIIEKEVPIWKKISDVLLMYNVKLSSIF